MRKGSIGVVPMFVIVILLMVVVVILMLYCAKAISTTTTAAENMTEVDNALTALLNSDQCTGTNLPLKALIGQSLAQNSKSIKIEYGGAQSQTFNVEDKIRGCAEKLNLWIWILSAESDGSSPIIVYADALQNLYGWSGIYSPVMSAPTTLKLWGLKNAVPVTKTIAIPGNKVANVTLVKIEK